MDALSPTQASPHLINPWLPDSGHHPYVDHRPESPRRQYVEQETEDRAPGSAGTPAIGGSHTLRRPSSTPLILVTARTLVTTPNEGEGEASHWTDPVCELRRSSSAVQDPRDGDRQHEGQLDNERLTAPPGHKPSQAAYTTLFDVSTSHKRKAVREMSNTVHDRWTMILELQELLRSSQHFVGHRDSLVLARQTLHRMSVSTCLWSKEVPITKKPRSDSRQEELGFDADEVEVT